MLSLACSPAGWTRPVQAGRLAGELSPFLLERDADAVPWRPWGAEALAEARHRKRPVFVLVGRAQAADCAAPERALGAAPEVGGLLARRFVSVAVDADERPDVADLYATAAVALGHEPDAEGGALWAVLTPDGWPYAAGTARDDSAFRTAFAAQLERLADDLQERTGEVAARAGAALAALRQAQASEPALRPLGRDAVEHAIKGLHDSFEPATGRFGGALHGPLRLLLAEAEGGHEDARRLLRRSLDALERREPPRCGARLAEHAARLRVFARAYALTGELRYRAAAERLADAAAELKDASGAFQAGPGDARVFAGANGLLIGALAVSGAALGRAPDVAAARLAAEAVLARLGPAASLRHGARGGEARGAALLVDYAELAEGLLDLDGATPDAAAGTRPAREATALVEAALGRFGNPRGGFFDTDAAHEPLPARLRSGYDGEGLSGNGVMAGVLLRLAALTGEERDTVLARGTVEAFLGDLQRAPRGLETLAAVASRLLGRGPAAGLAEASGTPAETGANGSSPGGRLPARETRGPVTVALALVPARARPGATIEARVTLAVADGWSVNAHRPRSRDLVALTVSVPMPELRTTGPVYPVPSDVPRRFATEPALAYVGTTRVVVPLRVPAGAAAGTRRVRVRVGFQACDARACRAPNSVVLEAPLEVAGK